MTGKVLPEYKPFIITPFWGFLPKPHLHSLLQKKLYRLKQLTEKESGFGHPESLQFLSVQG